MARRIRTLRLTVMTFAGFILAGNLVWAESPDRQIYQVAQNVPGLDTLDEGQGTLGGEEEPVFETPEKSKDVFEKSKSIEGKKLRSTTSGPGKDDATTLIPYSQFFTAGYVGDEMDPVGGI